MQQIFFSDKFKVSTSVAIFLIASGMLTSGLLMPQAWAGDDSGAVCRAGTTLVSEAASPELLQKFVRKYLESRTAEDRRNDKSIQTDGLVQNDPRIEKWHARPFTKVITTAGEVTDQEQSGDCWIHAFTNEEKSELIRLGIVDKGFQFSRNWLYFVSVYEKSNTYIQEVINSMADSLDSPVFAKKLRLNADGVPEYFISDGGEFSFDVFLAAKYGLVPYDAMPDTAVSLNTDAFLNELRHFVIHINEKIVAKIKSYGPITKYTEAQEAELQAIKVRGIREITQYMTKTLWPPQKNKSDTTIMGSDFKFEFAVKGSKPGEKPEMVEFTPLSFAQNLVKFDPDRNVVFSNTPLQPYGEAYTIKKFSSAGLPEKGEAFYREHYVNIRAKRMLTLIKKMIDADKAVYFTADVTKDVDVKTGTMDPRLKTTAKLLKMKTRSIISRRAAINAGLYSVDHAMAIIGYETDDDGNIIRLKVRNSWGKKAGQNGDFSMSLDWFKLYVFEVAIDHTLVSPREWKLWRNPHPVVIPSIEKYYGPS